RVADEFIGDRPVPNAVVERGQFVGADLVAVDAGRLLGSRRFRGGGQIGLRGKGGGSRSGKEIAARQSRHGVSVSRCLLGTGRASARLHVDRSTREQAHFVTETARCLWRVVVARSQTHEVAVESW